MMVTIKGVISVFGCAAQPPTNSIRSEDFIDEKLLDHGVILNFCDTESFQGNVENDLRVIQNVVNTLLERNIAHVNIFEYLLGTITLSIYTSRFALLI